MESSARPEPPADALPWTKGLAPRYIALFLLVAYYDQLAPRTLAVGGLLPTAGGLVVGAILAVALFFRPLALTGLTARIGLEEACARAFGRGAAWLVPGLLMGLTHVVWFAVAIDLALEYALRALVAFGLLDPAHLPLETGHVITPPPTLFIGVALTWACTSAILGLVTYRLVAAIMAGYQPFVAVALAAAAGWAFPLAGGFVAPGVDMFTSQTPAWPALAAAVRMVELLLGFFATHALLGVDWGKASRDRSDVEAGGWVGVAMAAVSTGCLALLIVAGANGRRAVVEPAGLDGVLHGQSLTNASPNAPFELVPQDYTVRNAIPRMLGRGPIAGTILIVLSAGLLGPACFAPLHIARFMRLVVPAVPRWVWTVGAAVAIWPLIAARFPERLDLIFTGLGVLIAPIVGVLSATWTRTRGMAPERGGVRMTALLAWLAGMGLGAALALSPSSSGIVLPTLAAYALAWMIQSMTLRGVATNPG